MKSKSIYFLYRLLQALVSPLVLLYFLLRGPRYFGTLIERLGFLPLDYRQAITGAIWFHGVSVGEVIALAPLIERFSPAFVSTSTLAGFATARDRLKTRVFFAPLDYAFAVRRVLRTIRPTVLVVAETEIWPNLFREAARVGCRVMIVNGRISDSAAKRYYALKPFFRAVLQHVDKILVQSDAQRERYMLAGAAAERIEVGGNLKYDFAPRPTEESIHAFFTGAKVWIAASTSADARIAEEDFVIDAHKRLPGWKLLLAPRQPSRFGEVARKLRDAKIPFVRRSEMADAGDLLLLDTIGELSSLFPLADVVFMGGTLANRGGHNILEPAYYGKPIVVGPHMENFHEIAAEFRACGAMLEIGGPSELADAVKNAAANCEMGLRAKACAEARRGAVDRAAKEIEHLRADALPHYPRTHLYGPLAHLWRLFRRRMPREQERINARVISVGNITTGGTGKTPVVLYIARHLASQGRRPGILTRGYGRQSHHEHLFLEPGATASVVHTGDEPQIFLRAGVAHLGIGANRVRVGRMLKERFQLDTLILDDGFQQLKLARDVDIVLIDSLNPFGDGHIAPRGRLREPMEALARATAFLITRTDCRHSTAGIERRLHEYNPHAPIFRSRVAPQEWVNAGTGEKYPARELPFARTIAFCGLGNHQSFWKTLDALGITPFERLEYGDHHLYTPREVLRIGMMVKELRLDALLTTEKDLVNLCESTEAVVAPAKILWLRIGIEIENEAEFLKLLG